MTGNALSAPPPRGAPSEATPWRLGWAHLAGEPLDWFTAAELDSLRALESATRRIDWCAGRVAAKRAVMALLPVDDPRRIEIAAGPGGRPVVRLSRLPATEGEQHRACAAHVSLSLSHRDGRALAVAATGERQVGIDVERSEAVPPAHARYFLTALERESGIELPQLWALKEAAWKALERDATLPFTDLELRFDSRGRLAAIGYDEREHPADFLIGQPWPGYVVAAVLVAAERGS